MTSFDALSPQKDFLPLIDQKRETALTLSSSVKSTSSHTPRKRHYSQTKSNVPTTLVNKRGSKLSNDLTKNYNNNNSNNNSSKVVVKKMDDIPYGLSDDDDDDDFTNINNSNSTEDRDHDIIHDQFTSLTTSRKNIQPHSIKNSPDTKVLGSSLVTDDDFSLITISPIPPTSSPFNQLSQMDDSDSCNNNNNNSPKRSSPFSQFDMLPTQLYEPKDNVMNMNAPTQLYNVYDIPTQPYDPNTNISTDYGIPTQPYDVNDHLADDCPTQIYSPNENNPNNSVRDLPTQLYKPNDDIGPTQIYDPYGDSIPTTQLVDIFNDESEENEDSFLLENIHSTDMNKANLNIHNKHHNIPNTNKNSNHNIHISTQDYNDYGVGYERDILDDDSEDEINNVSITKTYRNYLLPAKKLPMKNYNIRKNHHSEDSDLDFPLLDFDSGHDITTENNNNDKDNDNDNILPEKSKTPLSSSSTSLLIQNNSTLQTHEQQQKQKNIIKTKAPNNVDSNNKQNRNQSSLEEFYSYLSSGSSVSTAKSPSPSSSLSSPSHIDHASLSSPPFPSSSSPLKKNMSLSQQSSISSSSPLKKLSLTKNTKRTTYSSNDPLWMSSLSSSPLEEKSKKEHESLQQQQQKEQKMNKVEEKEEEEKEEKKKDNYHHNIKQPSTSILSSITITTNNNNNHPKRIRFPRLGISKRSPIPSIHKRTPNLDPTHTIIPYHKSTTITPLSSPLLTPSVSRKTLGMKKRNRNPLK
ncbi:unnamed protein product [Cunninghamella echinulata]